LAFILVEQGRFAESIRLNEEVIRVAHELGAAETSTHFSGPRASIAAAHVAEARWKEALAMFDQAENGLVGESQALSYLDVPERVLALYGGGRGADGLALARRLAAKWRDAAGERNYATAESRALVGMGLAQGGAKDAALAEFRAAVPILLQRSRQPEDSTGSAVMRDLRLNLILQAYIDLLADLQSAGSAPPGLDPVAEAFWVADALRGQGVQRALGASGARAAARDPQLADLVRREQDARRQIGALYGLFNGHVSLPAEQRDPAVLTQLQSSIDKLREARAVLAEEIERRFPDYADLIDPRPATVEQARAALRPGEALLALHVGSKQTLVWAIPKMGPIAFAAAPLGEAQVEQAVQRLRRALDPNARSYGEIPAFDVVLAHDLYRQLLEPVARGWQGAQDLLVVPHKAFSRLPLGLLVTAPAPQVTERDGQALFAGYRAAPFLARKVALTQLPSVASLSSLRRIPVASATRRAFIGFGDPWFSAEQAAAARSEASMQQAALQADGQVLARSLPMRSRGSLDTRGLNSASLARLPRLPETADEVRSIAQALGADPVRDVVLGAAANERTVATMALSDRRVLMFATHGLVAGDLDGLDQPALALSAPQVAGIEGDGLLTLQEILGLRLDADWVVLSACNSAAADGAGAEAISGLGRAFFYAGSRALLVSHWPVETHSAKALTTDIFRRQAANPALSRAQAARQAMLALIDGNGLLDAGGRTVVSYAHPIFWAPFAVVGDGG
jgi:CHAT domain-containing protein